MFKSQVTKHTQYSTSLKSDIDHTVQIHASMSSSTLVHSTPSLSTQPMQNPGVPRQDPPSPAQASPSHTHIHTRVASTPAMSIWDSFTNVSSQYHKSPPPVYSKQPVKRALVRVEKGHTNKKHRPSMKGNEGGTGCVVIDLSEDLITTDTTTDTCTALPSDGLVQGEACAAAVLQEIEASARSLHFHESSRGTDGAPLTEPMEVVVIDDSDSETQLSQYPLPPPAKPVVAQAISTLPLYITHIYDLFSCFYHRQETQLATPRVYLPTSFRF